MEKPAPDNAVIRSNSNVVKTNHDMKNTFGRKRSLSSHPFTSMKKTKMESKSCSAGPPDEEETTEDLVSKPPSWSETASQTNARMDKIVCSNEEEEEIKEECANDAKTPIYSWVWKTDRGRCFRVICEVSDAGHVFQFGRS